MNMAVGNTVNGYRVKKRILSPIRAFKTFRIITMGHIWSSSMHRGCGVNFGSTPVTHLRIPRDSLGCTHDDLQSSGWYNNSLPAT